MDNIQFKERSVEELALFIKNKTDEKQSLYCMLLGAGASKSSGIRTGQDLVEYWREIFYKKISHKGVTQDISIQEKKELLSKEFAWYKPDNEYSSFFGKIYDLPNQRRNFIELEVNDKEPSIGYHYLNKLAIDNYIETFFTTNFDDLLEQAFIDANRRPIVCPHDSSVKNISVTSHRTKIIKLHGDFLFNTLQSTEAETKILKENMKNKFEEFLKNYGLIVLGYAGFDSSVMDVLIDLVSQADYLNNGIYWCIKKEEFEKDNLSPKLRELLSKDKVYYILIDNFDSFAAKLAHLVIEKDIIPLGSTHLSRLENRQKFFIKQKDLFANDLLITNDVNDCLASPPFSDQNNYDIDNNFKSPKEKNSFMPVQAKENNSQKTLEDVHIYELMWNKNYNEALAIIDKKNMNNIPSYKYNKYMNMKIKCFLKLKQKEKALDIIDQVLNYNERNKKDSNIPILLEKANIVSSIPEKIQIIESALQQDCNNIDIINFLAETKIQLVKHNSNLYQNIIDLYDRSISLQSSSNNEAYLEKLNFVKKYSNENKKEQILNTCKQIIQDIENKDYYSLCVYDAKMEQLYQKEKDKKDNSNIDITTIKDLFNEYINGNCIYERNEMYLREYLNILSKLSQYEELENMFYKYDNENKYNVEYFLQKADIVLSKFKNLDEAIKILENIDKNLIKMQSKLRNRFYNQYFDYLLYNSEHDKICKIADNEPDSKILSRFNAYKEALFHIDKNKYFEIIYKDFDNSEKSTDDYIAYTYSLLKLEMYQEIYNICKELFANQQKNINVDVNNDILRINYNLAKKYINKTITKSNLEYIFSQKSDSLEKAAAYILIDKQEEAQKILSTEISDDYQYYYSLQVMPAFQSIDFENLKLQQVQIKN